MAKRREVQTAIRFTGVPWRKRTGKRMIEVEIRLSRGRKLGRHDSRINCLRKFKNQIEVEENKYFFRSQIINIYYLLALQKSRYYEMTFIVIISVRGDG